MLYDDITNQHYPLELPATTTTDTPADPAPADTPAEHSNRSGLGDGTNPGAGSEHNAGGNQGTNNPGGLKK